MSEYKDDVDLRPYLLALKRRWWLILLVGALAAGAALVYSLTQPQAYKATAMILLTRSRSRLALAEQFPTVNETVDSKSRMDALVSITESDAIAMATLQALRDQLPPAEQALKTLKSQVEINTEGDIIEVIAMAGEPDLASTIANTWAQQAAAVINAAYGGEQPITLIQAGLGSAREKYETAQSAYESFVKASQTSFLEAQATELDNLLRTLAGERSWQASYYSQRMQRMDQILADAKALQSQLKGGSDSAAASVGDALAVLTAHASAFGVNPQFINVPDSNAAVPKTSGGAEAPPVAAPQNNPPATTAGLVINVQLDGMADLANSAAGYQQDLDRLIEQATLQREDAEANLEKLAAQVAQGEGNELLIATAAQLQDVQERLEAETARERELDGERDLAWDTYEAMLQKEAELVNASAAINEVTLAGPAIEPQHPADRGAIRNAVVGGVIGMLLAIGTILFLEWWRSANLSG